MEYYSNLFDIYGFNDMEEFPQIVQVPSWVVLYYGTAKLIYRSAASFKLIFALVWTSRLPSV
jgi:hypothetical protein